MRAAVRRCDPAVALAPILAAAPREPARAATALPSDPLSSAIATAVEHANAPLVAELAELRAAVANAQSRPALLTPRALAAQLSVSRATVQRLAAEGMPRVTVGMVPRYDLAEVLSWLRDRAAESGSRTSANRGEAANG